MSGASSFAAAKRSSIGSSSFLSIAAGFQHGAIVRLLNKFPDPPNKDVGEGMNTAFEKMHQLGFKEPSVEERDSDVLVKLHGFGVFLHAKPAIKGDRYRGEFKNGVYSNAGVYEYGENPTNKYNTLRYEGDFVNGVAIGHGAFVWRNGTTYYGGLVGGFLGGAGVQAWTDGRRYEGEFDKGIRAGLGVLWNADGSAGGAGRWADGELSEAMAK